MSETVSDSSSVKLMASILRAKCSTPFPTKYGTSEKPVVLPLSLWHLPHLPGVFAVGEDDEVLVMELRYFALDAFSLGGSRKLCTGRWLTNQCNQSFLVCDGLNFVNGLPCFNRVAAFG